MVQEIARLAALVDETALVEITIDRLEDGHTYVRELQRIALGQGPSRSARDRLAALRELLKLEKRGTTSYIEGASEDDPEVQRRWAEVRRADSLSRLESLEGKFGISD